MAFSFSHTLYFVSKVMSKLGCISALSCELSPDAETSSNVFSWFATNALLMSESWLGMNWLSFLPANLSHFREAVHFVFSEIVSGVLWLENKLLLLPVFSLIGVFCWDRLPNVLVVSS